MYVYVESSNNNKYYRGFGEIKSDTYDNIETNSTPVDCVEEKKQYYKLIEITTYKKQTVNHVDNNGNIINTYDINIPVKSYGWEFDEVAWESSGVVVEPSDKEKIEELQQENDNLTSRVSTIQEVNATQEETINTQNDLISSLQDMIITMSMQ